MHYAPCSVIQMAIGELIMFACDSQQRNQTLHLALRSRGTLRKLLLLRAPHLECQPQATSIEAERSLVVRQESMMSSLRLAKGCAVPR